MSQFPFALDLPSGLNSDDTSFAASGRWADCNNVRFVDGSPQVVGEYAALFPGLGGAIYNMFAWDRSGTTHIAYARFAALYVGVGAAAPVARTPAGSPLNAHAWAFASWGDTLLFVPTGRTLYQQSGTANATAIAPAPDAIAWMLVTPERQVLAFGCNEELSGSFNGLCIRGSDLEDFSDWTTSSTNNAFEHILDGAGRIVTARMVGPYVAVWTDNALHLGQYLGDPAQTYRFDQVAQNCGIVGPNAVAVVGQQAYWLGRDLRLRAWAPGTDVQTIGCPIFREFAMDVAIDPTNRGLTHLAHVSKYDELRIHYRTQDGVSEGKYIAVSLGDRAWSKGDAARFSSLTSDILYSVIGASYGTNMISADVNGSVYATECGTEVNSDGPISWHLQSADLSLGAGNRRMLIKRLRPDFETASGTVNDGPVSLTFGLRDSPQSMPVVKGPFAIPAGAAKKDLRLSGRIVSVRLGAVGSNVNRELRLGRLVFDLEPLGER